MEERLLKALQDELPDIDFTSSELVDDGILDSLALTSIIAIISMEFDIMIPYEEIKADNFNSLPSMVSMVERISMKKTSHRLETSDESNGC